MSVTDLLQLLRDVPSRLRDGSALIEDLHLISSDLRHTVARVTHLSTIEPQPEPTYVYVLPLMATMMAQRVFVPRGGSVAVAFEPYVPIPAGTWIVAVGPGIVEGVKVGNQHQSVMADYQGHVCQLKDEAPPGYRITVGLRG